MDPHIWGSPQNTALVHVGQQSPSSLFNLYDSYKLPNISGVPRVQLQRLYVPRELC